MANIKITISCECDHCGKPITVTESILTNNLCLATFSLSGLAKKCFEKHDPLFGHKGPNNSILCNECFHEYKKRMYQYRELMDAYSNEYVHMTSDIDDRL